MAKNSACMGKETFEGYFKSPEACGAVCRGKSDMFTYGTSAFGDPDSCNERGCRCNCQLETTNDFCKEDADQDGYNLYAQLYKGK